MHVLLESRDVILFGLIKTVELFVASAAVACVVGFVLGMLRTGHNAWVRVFVSVIVETLRGVSTVVVLFWLYFVLPLLGISLPADVAAIIGLGLVHGAYSSEVVRTALLDVSKQQWEAASALGLSRWAALRKVVLPQALVVMMPPFGNEAVLLLQGTSIASLVTVHELTFQADLLVTRTFAVTEIFLSILVIYYSLSVIIVHMINEAEQRLGRWRPQV